MGFRSSTHNSVQAANSLACTRPTGAVTGDILVAFVRTQDTAPAMTAPSGWTVRQEAVIGSSPASRFAICTADGAVSSLTWTFADATADLVIDVLCYTSVGAVDGSSIAAGSTSSGTTIGAGAGVTPTTAASIVVCGYSARQGTGPTIDPPAGQTERTDNSFPSILETADEAYVGTSATGSRTATLSAAQLNRIGGMVVLTDTTPSGSPAGPRTISQFAGFF